MHHFFGLSSYILNKLLQSVVEPFYFLVFQMLTSAWFKLIVATPIRLLDFKLLPAHKIEGSAVAGGEAR
jgi:hypothetical protein